MRIMTRNIVEENSSIVMTNPDVNHPVGNVYSNMLEEYAASSIATSLITITFLSNKIANSIFFGYHNLTDVDIVFKNSIGGTIGTVNLTYPELNMKHYMDELDTIRSIEITIETGEAVAFLGNFACGVYTQLGNVVKPRRINYIDSTDFEQTTGGQSLYNLGTMLQSFDVGLTKNTDSQLVAFISAYMYVRKGKGFWLDRYEDILLRSPLYGIFSSDFNTDEIDELTNINFTFTEAN